MKKTSKKGINKKGFSKAEFMVMLAVIAILIAAGSYIAVNSTKSYSSFKTISDNFASAVALYKDKAIIQKDEYNLYEVEKAGFIGTLTSPFDKNVECDKYESYVTLENSSKKGIVLLCDTYLVEGVQGGSYKIYEVSEWDENKGDYNDGGVLYNYKDKGNLALDKYAPLKTFLALFSEKTGKAVTKVADIKGFGYEVVNKMVYRNKELVKEFK